MGRGTGTRSAIRSPTVAARSPVAAAAREPQGDMAPDFARLFARGAGLTDDAFAARDPAELAEQIGQLMMLVLANLKQLLEARQHAKRLARSSNQTMIQAVDNNPLKFAPTAEEAMRIMFGTKTRSYLDAKVALNQSFDDVKKHQIKTYAAMQHALKALLEELDPANIESESGMTRFRRSVGLPQGTALGRLCCTLAGAHQLQPGRHAPCVYGFLCGKLRPRRKIMWIQPISPREIMPIFVTAVQRPRPLM